MATRKDSSTAAATKEGSRPLPSNEQIDNVLEKAQGQVHEAHQHTEGLDPLGHQLLNDLERVVESTRAFVEEKNEGDRVQRLVAESKLATPDVKELTKKGAHKDALEALPTEQLQPIVRDTLQTARAAAIELLKSRRFRQELRDTIALITDILEQQVTEGADQLPQEQKQIQARDVGRRAAGDEVPVEVLPPTVPMPAGTEAYRGFQLGREVEIPIEGADEHDSKGLGLTEKLQSGITIGSKQIKLTPEQLNQLSDRFNALLKQITERESTQSLFRGLLKMVRVLEEESDTSQLSENVQQITENEHLKNTLVLAKEIFESFTGPNSLDPLIDHFRALAKIFREDPEAKSFFQDTRAFLLDLLDNPNKIGTDEANKSFKELVNRVRALNDEKLNEHLNGSLTEIKALINKAETDPATLRLKQDIKRLISDLMLDEKGNLSLRPQVIEQLRLIIIQSLVERMRIPIPNVTVDKKKIEMRLTNMVLTLRDLVPERVIVKNKGRVALDLGNLRSKGVGTQFDGELLVFKIKNVNVYMDDANIWFRRKTFPKVTDEGKLRINIGGSGVDIKIGIRVLSGSKDVFQVQRVKCKLHNMKLHLSDTQHDFLYNSLLRVLSPRIKHNIEHAVEDNVTGYLQRINKLLMKQGATAKGALGGVANKGASLASPLTSAIAGPVNTLTSKITGESAQ